jgi:carboxylesterase type B
MFGGIDGRTSIGCDAHGTIKSFGGDTGNVLNFGLSGGGGKVSTLCPGPKDCGHAISVWLHHAVRGISGLILHSVSLGASRAAQTSHDFQSRVLTAPACLA